MRCARLAVLFAVLFAVCVCGNPTLPTQYSFSGVVYPIDGPSYKIAFWQGASVSLQLNNSGTFQLVFDSTSEQNCTMVTYNASTCKYGCYNGGGGCPNTKDDGVSLNGIPPPPPPNMSCGCTSISIFSYIPLAKAYGNCTSRGVGGDSYIFFFPHNSGNITYCFNGSTPLSMTVLRNPNAPHSDGLDTLLTPRVGSSHRFHRRHREDDSESNSDDNVSQNSQDDDNESQNSQDDDDSSDEDHDNEHSDRDSDSDGQQHDHDSHDGPRHGSRHGGDESRRGHGHSRGGDSDHESREGPRRGDSQEGPRGPPRDGDSQEGPHRGGDDSQEGPRRPARGDSHDDESDDREDSEDGETRGPRGPPRDESDDESHDNDEPRFAHRRDGRGSHGSEDQDEDHHRRGGSSRRGRHSDDDSRGHRNGPNGDDRDKRNEHHRHSMPPPPPPPPPSNSSSSSGSGTIDFYTWNPEAPPSSTFNIPSPCSCPP